jgi:flagellar protein FliO/FliZ
MTFPRAFTSVTRWLLVVIGCVVLATAQPMSSSPAPAAPEAPAAVNRSSDTIIYPKNAAESVKTATNGDRDTSRSLILVVALLLAAGGAWVFLQRRKAGPTGGRGRKLQIDETRPLGNRQYLVVADYDGKKFLLGVAPGQIQMLTPLDGTESSKAKGEAGK